MFNIQLFRTRTGMRPITVKQAQKWLEKVKNANPNSFRELSKIFKKYERNSDDYECFVKVNTLLLEHPDLTTEINNYLQEGNKFVVNQSEVEKINELVKYIRKVDLNSFQEIASYITKLHSDRRNLPSTQNNQDQQNRLVRNQVLNQVKGKPELETYAQKALFLSAEQMIKQLDLGHLKPTKPLESVSKQQPEEPAQTPYQPPAQREEAVIQFEKPKTKTFPPFISQNEEKYFFRQFQGTLDSKIYEQVLKIIHIYYLGIISRVEALDLLKNHCGNDFAAIKDLIESRQTDRRKNSDFRPLNDMFFINFERATHSYVKMPNLYPHYCSHNNSFLKEILNKKWVSVPTGSQQAFNVRIKNSYQQNLIKAQDDRYQFDIYCKRLEKAIFLLEKALIKLRQKPDADISKDIQKIISLGSVQTLYKNTSKQQREELEFHLRSMKYDTLIVFESRMKSQYAELMEMRSIHGLRTWTEVANKNFQKALDFKGHEFKRTQKVKMKAGVFLEQLKLRINYLNSRGENKSYDTPFEDRRQFFSILNSFQTSSRKQKCVSRRLPPLKVYNIKQYKIPTLLPAIILAFEDDETMTSINSFVSFYIQNAVINEAEKIRCKSTFKEIMSRFFKKSKFETRCLSNVFDEDKFFTQILNCQPFDDKISDWVHTEFENDYQPPLIMEQSDKIFPFNSLRDSPSSYGFEPPKSSNNLVFYAIDNFYVFLRFLYALYERIIRMKEVADSEKKTKLFQILFFTCIKAKQSARFQQSLNSLFGQYAYLFSTFYKLLQNIQKSINAISLCPFYNESEKLMIYDSEEIYLMLLNRFMLNTGMTSSRLMRFTFEFDTKILYINSFDSYYRIDDQAKELQKRRADITSKIEIYTLLKSEQAEEKIPIPVLRNQIQYCFEGNSIKMINLSSKEDFMVSERKPIKKQSLLNEIRRNRCIRQKFI